MERGDELGHGSCGKMRSGGGGKSIADQEKIEKEKVPQSSPYVS